MPSFGKQSQDTDAGLTGSMVAELLEVPCVSSAVGIAEADGGFLVNAKVTADKKWWRLVLDA